MFPILPTGSGKFIASAATAAILLLSMPVAAQEGTICTIFADAGTGRVLQQEGTCDQRMSPASTFKIAISLMGYDAGVLVNEHEPALPFKAGYPDWGPNWKQTTDPEAWMRNSVVWYSQQVTQALGIERFTQYVGAFDYGNEDASGDPGQDNALTRAWLSSSLQISPLEQLAFLQAIVNRGLPVSEHAYEMTAALTGLGTLSNGWEVHGKTGTGYPRKANGNFDYSRGFGWFVGWASKEGRTVLFARQVQDTERRSDSAGPRAKEALMEELPAILDWL